MTDNDTTDHRPEPPHPKTWTRDHYLALVLGLLALAATPISLYISHIFARTLPGTVAVGAFSYLVLARARYPPPKGCTLEGPRSHFPRDLTMLAPTLVFVTCSIAIVVSTVTGGRSSEFYAIMIIASILYLLQIVLVRDRDLWPNFLLVQLIVVLAALRFPALALTPSFIGIDILSHAPGYAETILETGSLRAGLGESKYLAAPVYHLIVVSTALLGDVSVRGGLYLSLGIAMLIAPLLVFLIARRIGVPPRWAIFCASLFGLADYVTYWSLHLIPSSVGLLFILSVLLLVTYHFSDFSPAAGKAVLLSVIFLAAIAVTDQVSAAIMVVIFGAAIIAQYTLAVVRRLLGGVNVGIDMTAYAIFFAGFVVLIWAFTPLYGESFTVVVLTLATESVGDVSLLTSGEAPEISQAAGETDRVATILTYLSRGTFLILLFGAVIGTLASLRPRSAAQSRWTIIVAAALTGFLSLAPPLVGVGTLLPGRWYAVLYIMLALLFSIGITVLSSDDLTTFPPIPIPPISLFGTVLLTILLISTAIAFPIAAIPSTVATIDAPVLFEEEPRRALTAPEQNAADTIRSITNSGEAYPVRSDAYFATAIGRPGNQDYYSIVIPDANEDGSEDARGANRIYRTYQTTGAPEFVAEGGEVHVTQVERSQICRETDSILYDNRDVRYCSA